MTVVLDTHTVLWYLENSKELSSAAGAAIEDAIRAANEVYVSAISLIETIYLVERGRVPTVALERLQSALEDAASGLVVASVDVCCGCCPQDSSHCRSRYARPHHRSYEKTSTQRSQRRTEMKLWAPLGDRHSLSRE